MRQALLTGFLLSLRLLAGAQTPDPGFGTGGQVITPLTGLDAKATALVIQPDQKLVLAGVINGTQDWLVARYLPSGALDPAFGTGGKLPFDFGFGYEVCFTAALQPTDAKILLGGQADGNFAIARLLPSGQPDPAFDTDGRVQVSFGTGNGSTVTQLLVQPDGKIVATGWAYNGTDFDFAAARLLTTGALDPSFGTGGLVRVPIGAGRDQAQAALLQPDGRIVLVGDTYDASGNARFGICRLTAAGAPDATFGTGGKQITTLQAGANSVPTAVLRQPDGKLLVTGESAQDAAVVRYTTAGTLDPTFGNGGIRTADLSNGLQDNLRAATLLPNGNIVLAGGSLSNSPSAFYEVTVTRFTSAGNLDTSFGTAGAYHATLGAYRSQAAAMVLQPDGKLVLGGDVMLQQGDPAALALLRLGASITGLSAARNQPELVVGPNPLTAASTVRFTLPAAGAVSYVVTDATGRRVAASGPIWLPAGPQQLPVPAVADLPAGGYLLTLHTATGARTVRVVR